MTKRREWTPPAIPAAEDLKGLLRTRYDARKGWILMFEARSHTGYSKGSGRYADALAFNVWPSAGLVLHGFEIKISRSDLNRELQAEGKDAIKRWCDHWWLVVPDLDLIEGYELPPDWGVLVRQGKRLVVHREVPQRAREPWPRDFVASLVRNAAEGSAELVAAKAELAGAEQRGREQQRGFDEKTIERHKAEAEAAEKKLDAFTRAADLGYSRWIDVSRLEELGRIAAACKGEIAAIKERRRLLAFYESAAQQLQEELEPKAEASGG